MKREQLEKLMKEKKIEQIDLVLHESDKLGIYCRLVGGKLKDYTNHVIDRKIDIWGYLYWKDGKSERRAFK